MPHVPFLHIPRRRPYLKKRSIQFAVGIRDTELLTNCRAINNLAERVCRTIIIVAKLEVLLTDNAWIDIRKIRFGSSLESWRHHVLHTAILERCFGRICRRHVSTQGFWDPYLVAGNRAMEYPWSQYLLMSSVGDTGSGIHQQTCTIRNSSEG
jgi:hypothetical protein